MSGHRQAAAALHGLAESDRGLILEQLPASDQATLRGYLAELTALGFEGAPAELLAPKAPRELASAPAAAVFSLLEHEPVALVAQVLAAQQWRWRDQLLALYTPARRDAILAVQVTAAPLRTRFLLDSLSRRLLDAEPVATPARSSSPFASLVRWVKSWQR
jgi:hypothetical protein